MRNAYASQCSDSQDLATVRTFMRELRIACDELHDDPFNEDARSAILNMLSKAAMTKAADQAFIRVKRSMRRSLAPAARIDSDRDYDRL